MQGRARVYLRDGWKSLPTTLPCLVVSCTNVAIPFRAFLLGKSWQTAFQGFRLENSRSRHPQALAHWRFGIVKPLSGGAERGLVVKSKTWVQFQQAHSIWHVLLQYQGPDALFWLPWPGKHVVYRCTRRQTSIHIQTLIRPMAKIAIQLQVSFSWGPTPTEQTETSLGLRSSYLFTTTYFQNLTNYGSFLLVCLRQLFM